MASIQYIFLKVFSYCILIAYLCTYAYAEILVNKLDDLQASVTSGRQNDLILQERLCVGSNPAGPFSLQILGSGDNGSFSIQNGPNILNYSAFVRDRFSRGRFRNVIPGELMSGFQSRRLRNNETCRGNSTVLRIIFAHEVFQAVPSGIYQGSIQITVIPE